MPGREGVKAQVHTPRGGLDETGFGADTNTPRDVSNTLALNGEALGAS